MSNQISVAPPSMPPAAPRLLDQVRIRAHAHFGRPEPGERFAQWIRRFVVFHGMRHPRELFNEDVGRFLEHIAQTEKNDPLGVLELAYDALTFLYGKVLQLPREPFVIPQPPRLLDRIRHAMRVGHYSPRTEECYVDWAVKFIRFHRLRHPNTMGAPEIELFLTDLAVHGHVSASTQNQAFNALLFLYQRVLAIELPRLDAVRAKRPKRLPSVLCPEEVAKVLNAVEGGDGVFRLMAGLCYGSGLRREECCRLRVHDVDLRRDQITVRHGKGGKDRVVMLPKSRRAELERHLAWRRQLHERDRAAGLARVALPDALARKYPRAAQELGWQFLFASRQRSRDPKTGDIGRHHVDPGSLARTITAAGRAAGIVHRVGCHTLRHSFATHLVERGVDIRTISGAFGPRKPGNNHDLHAHRPQGRGRRRQPARFAGGIAYRRRRCGRGGVTAIAIGSGQRPAASGQCLAGGWIGLRRRGRPGAGPEHLRSRSGAPPGQIRRTTGATRQPVPCVAA